MGRGIGRQHKANTGNSKRSRTSAARVNIYYGNGNRNGNRKVRANETKFAELSDNIVDHPSNGPANNVDPVPVTTVEATSEPLVQTVPTFVQSFEVNYYLIPFLNSNFQKTDTAVFTSLTMTRSEYGEFLVNMGNRSGSKFLLPNLQSKMDLENVLVTLEFSHDIYNGLLGLKEKNLNDTATVSFVMYLIKLCHGSITEAILITPVPNCLHR